MRNRVLMKLTLCALFTSLIAVGAYIKIPVPYVPFTLQFLFVILAGLILPKYWGFFSCLLYMLIGLIGIPVFASGSGIGYFVNPSFGYILGFCLATLLMGTLSKSKLLKFKQLLFLSLMGLMIIFTMGMIYYYLIMRFYLQIDIRVWTVILYCFIVFLPGDLFLCVVASIIANRLLPIMRNN